MPHLKCVACRTRLYQPAPLPKLVYCTCEACGLALEAVGDLSEIIGFRFVGWPVPRLVADHWIESGGDLEGARRP